MAAVISASEGVDHTLCRGGLRIADPENRPSVAWAARVGRPVEIAVGGLGQGCVGTSPVGAAREAVNHALGRRDRWIADLEDRPAVYRTAPRRRPVQIAVGSRDQRGPGIASVDSARKAVDHALGGRVRGVADLEYGAMAARAAVVGRSVQIAVGLSLIH